MTTMRVASAPVSFGVDEVLQDAPAGVRTAPRR